MSSPSDLAVPIGNTLWPIGGGLTRWLVSKIKEYKIPAIVLIAFCGDGDFKGIAMHVADRMYQILVLERGMRRFYLF